MKSIYFRGPKDLVDQQVRATGYGRIRTASVRNARTPSVILAGCAQPKRIDVVCENDKKKEEGKWL